MSTTQLRRLSFARADLERQTTPKPERQTCKWCGSPARFRYGVTSDSRPAGNGIGKEQFCSLDCWATYKDIDLENMG